MRPHPVGARAAYTAAAIGGWVGGGPGMAVSGAVTNSSRPGCWPCATPRAGASPAGMGNNHAGCFDTRRNN